MNITVLKYFSNILLAVVLTGNVWAADKNCLNYEPSKVTLSGEIVVQTFPGPPNYEDITKGDQPETYWILVLGYPICINADENNPLTEYEPEVKAIQLVLIEEQYKNYKKFLDKPVVVIGTLSHSLTGHHHTAVLLTVEKMDRLDKRHSPTD